MINKGIQAAQSDETPKIDQILERPLKTIDIPKKKRVDINELVAKLEVKEKKRARKNTIIFSCLTFSLAIVGIFLTN